MKKQKWIDDGVAPRCVIGSLDAIYAQLKMEATCLKCNRIHQVGEKWTHDALTRAGYERHTHCDRS
jgi:hypothetical protein